MAENDISPIITQADTPVIRGRGYFTLGSLATFLFEFPSITGDRYDPSSITAEIFDPNQTLLDTITEMDKLELGKYGFSWLIPETSITGTYIMRLTYVAETETGEETLSHDEYFIVGSQSSRVIPPRLIATRGLLESFIGYSQRIPIYDEIGRLTKDRTTADFTFPRWNQPAKTKVYINGYVSEIGYTVNYVDGKIIFNHPLSHVDEVTASYNFRWFEDDELHEFITEGINIFNQYAPHTTYNIDSLPDMYVSTATMQAAVFALRRLIMDLMYQEPAKVYGGMDRADKIIGSLDGLKKNYEDQLDKLYGEKVKFPYAGLTKTITVPEYTLPGSRSRWFRYLFSNG